MGTSAKSERIEIRVTDEEKKLFEGVAGTLGVSTWMRVIAVRAAKRQQALEEREARAKSKWTEEDQ